MQNHYKNVKMVIQIVKYRIVFVHFNNNNIDLRGDTGVKICEILIFYHFCVFGIIIKIKLFTSM